MDLLDGSLMILAIMAYQALVSTKIRFRGIELIL